MWVLQVLIELSEGFAALGDGTCDAIAVAVLQWPKLAGIDMLTDPCCRHQEQNHDHQ